MLIETSAPQTDPEVTKGGMNEDNDSMTPECRNEATEFEAGCERLFRDLDTCNRIDIFALQSLTYFHLLKGRVPSHRVLWLAERIPHLLRDSIPRVRELYFALVKFALQSCDDYNEAISAYLSSYRAGNNDELPRWELQYEKYDEEVTKFVKCFNDSLTYQEPETEVFEEMYAEFAWLIFVSPESTLLSVLVRCGFQQTLHHLFQILRRFPVLKHLCVKAVGKDADKDGENAQIPLVLCVLRRMLHDRKFWSSKILTAERISFDWERFAVLVGALGHEAYAVLNGNELDVKRDGKTPEHYGLDVPDQAILCGDAILKGLVLPELASRSSRTNISCLFRIALEILSGPKLSPCRWAPDTKKGTFPGLDAAFYFRLSAPGFVKLVLDIFSTDARSNESLPQLCYKLLAALGARFKQDHVVFSHEDAEDILRELRHYNWAVKYALFSWLDECLGQPQREIPLGLKKVLSASVRDDYQPYTPNGAARGRPGHFLQCLLELADVAPELACDLIQNGFGTDADDSLLLKLACEFMLPFDNDPVKAPALFSEMFFTLKRLCEALGPSRKLLTLPMLSGNLLSGFSIAEPLLVLCNVVMTAVNLNQSGSEWTGNTGEFFRLGKGMTLEIFYCFCYLVEEHFANEIRIFRETVARRENDSWGTVDDSEDVEIANRVSLNTQISEMLIVISLVAQRYGEVLNCLKKLVRYLSNCQKEMMRPLALPNLDEDDVALKPDLVSSSASADLDCDLPYDVGWEADLQPQHHPQVDDGNCSSDSRERLSRSHHRSNKIKALANFDESDFKVVYSEVPESEPGPSEYFTSIARQLPERMLRSSAAKLRSGECGSRKVFHQAVHDIKKENNFDPCTGRCQLAPGGRARRISGERNPDSRTWDYRRWDSYENRDTDRDERETDSNRLWETLEMPFGSRPGIEFLEYETCDRTRGKTGRSRTERTESGEDTSCSTAQDSFKNQGSAFRGSSETPRTFSSAWLNPNAKRY